VAATAVLSETALPLLEVVADLVQFFDWELFDVALVNATAVLAKAAAASEVVFADFLGNVGIRVTRSTWLALGAGAPRRCADIVLGNITFVDATALFAEAAAASKVVLADLVGDIVVLVAWRARLAGLLTAFLHLVLHDIPLVDATALIAEAASAFEVVVAYFF
jgi:hypothetical protein